MLRVCEAAMLTHGGRSFMRIAHLPPQCASIAAAISTSSWSGAGAGAGAGAPETANSMGEPCCGTIVCSSRPAKTAGKISVHVADAERSHTDAQIGLEHVRERGNNFALGSAEKVVGAAALHVRAQYRICREVRGECPEAARGRNDLGEDVRRRGGRAVGCYGGHCKSVSRVVSFCFCF